MKEGMKVIVVEDNPEDSLRISKLLIQSFETAFECIKCNTLFSALEYLTLNSADIILLGLRLPDSQGYQTCLQMQSRFPHMPMVILIDTKDEKLASGIVKQDGAEDYLTKPRLTSQLLARSLRYAIELKSMKIKMLHMAKEWKDCQSRTAHTCHKINQPLQVILGYAELLQEHSSKEEFMSASMKTIKDQTKKISLLVRKLGLTNKHKAAMNNNRISALTISVFPHKSSGAPKQYFMYAKDQKQRPHTQLEFT